MTLEREAAAAAAAEPDEVFRARLREFFAAHHPGRPPKDPRERLAWTKAWLATLFDSGYAGPGWPREFGGMELPFPRQVIYQATIGAGTREIQLNTIGEQVLGLPHDPGMPPR